MAIHDAHPVLRVDDGPYAVETRHLTGWSGRSGLTRAEATAEARYLFLRDRCLTDDDRESGADRARDAVQALEPGDSRRVRSRGTWEVGHAAAQPVIDVRITRAAPDTSASPHA